MSKSACLTALMLLASPMAFAAIAAAQDVVGIEDCTKTQGLDKRTGCFQSNINYLQSLIAKNATDEARKLNAANAEIVSLKASVQALQKKLDELQAAAKPDIKPPDAKPKP